MSAINKSVFNWLLIQNIWWIIKRKSHIAKMFGKQALTIGYQYTGKRLSYVQLARTGATLAKEPKVYGSQVAKPVFVRADSWDKRKNIAMIDEHGTHTYGELSVKSRLVANALENELGGNSEPNKKVRF